MYRVTHHVDSNLLLTSNKSYALAWLGQTRPGHNETFVLMSTGGLNQQDVSPWPCKKFQTLFWCQREVGNNANGHPVVKLHSGSYLSVWKASGKRTAPTEASMNPSARVGSALGHICRKMLRLCTILMKFLKINHMKVIQFEGNMFRPLTCVGRNRWRKKSAD